jgi:hypothetical protein
MAESSFAQRDFAADALGDASVTRSSMRSVYDNVDWSSTALGPRDSWPALLRLLVDLCLDSEFPVQIGWGPDLLMLYNDSYIPLLGSTRGHSADRQAKWAHICGRRARNICARSWRRAGPTTTKINS